MKKIKFTLFSLSDNLELVIKKTTRYINNMYLVSSIYLALFLELIRWISYNVTS